MFVSNFLEIDPMTQIYPKFSFSKQSPRLCSSKEQLYFFLVQFNTTDRLFVKLQAYLIKIVHLKLVYEEFNFYPIQTLTCLVRECFISSVKSRGDNLRSTIDFNILNNFGSEILDQFCHTIVRLDVPSSQGQNSLYVSRLTLRR